MSPTMGTGKNPGSPARTSALKQGSISPLTLSHNVWGFVGSKPDNLNSVPGPHKIKENQPSCPLTSIHTLLYPAFSNSTSEGPPRTDYCCR